MTLFRPGQMSGWLFLVFVVLWGIATPLGTAAAETTPLGKPIDDFSLRDFRGKLTSLSDFRDRKLVVIALLGTECPLARLYGPRLVKLAERYAAQDVAFLGINANSQDSITEIAAYARLHNIEFPLLKDVGNRVADQLGATRTPEVFVLDQQRVVRYWGRIDDQYGVGYARDNPQRLDLKLALDELLAGRPVSTPITTSIGCHIGRRVTPKLDSHVTYSQHIAPILQTRCVECHRSGEIAPFALTSYDEVAGWAETIAEVIRDERMPPWHADPKYGRFSNDRRLSDGEKQVVYQWVAAGVPQGDPAHLPAPPQYSDGWQLNQQPDQVVYMRREPYRVPAEGTVSYQYFTADPGFTEDKWLKMAEVRPGNRAVVHHVLVFVKTPGSRFGDGEGYLAAYVPGLRATPLPPGMAKRIPAGAKLYFQVHYTPIGSVQQDRSMIAMVFAHPDEVTHAVMTASAMQRRLYIPPHVSNHCVEATSGTVGQDVLLLSMMPHMHLRGKSFRYEMLDTRGHSQILLDVPRYDFNWQTSYLLAEPQLIPAGTKIHCVAHYDNSENNLANPDPSVTVRWGPQSWDEMMFGYFDYAVPMSTLMHP
jgi:peroxiredoxin